MKNIQNYELDESQAGLWYLGQAGYIIRSAGVCVCIDPYLSDSVAKIAPDRTRLLPVPVQPEELRVDLFLVTHDHLDHLDPETVVPYRHKADTQFVAPRLACRKLAALGVPDANITRVDIGAEETVCGVRVRGIYAHPTEDAVADTVGYHLTFENGRSLYHSSDTGFTDTLLDAAPGAEVLLVCINGKLGNLNVEEAVRLTQAVRPHVAIPNHYDMMAPNQEDPTTFVTALKQAEPTIHVEVVDLMDAFVWNAKTSMDLVGRIFSRHTNTAANDIADLCGGMIM